jgi:hypothetical protein
MSTRPVLAGLALIVVLAATACSDDSGDDASATTSVTTASASTAVTATSVAVVTTTASPPADTSDLATADTGDLPPIGTGDLPPVGTGDLPPLPPVSSDVPYVLNVTVGIDADPARIERVPLGSTLTLTVTNPTADDEFHLHGFDLGDDQVMPAGQSASFTFVANQIGAFELESHTTGDVLMILEVV